MKIGIDARMLGYSGIGRYTKNLIRELLKIDKRNEYVIFLQKNDRNMKYEIGKEKNKKVTEIDAPIYSFAEQSNFLRALNKEKLDIMHFTHFNRPIFYNQPSIVTIHDLTPIYFPGKRYKSSIRHLAYRLVLKTALKKASKIIAVSNFTKKDIIKHFPFARNKIVVIYEGVDQRFAQRPAISDQRLGKLNIQKPYLLYTGVWREHKNLKGLIEAFNKLKSPARSRQATALAGGQISNLKSLKLVIVGKPDPYYPEVLEAAKNSPFKKDIILTGYVADSDLPALYQNAEVFVFPSFYEGFGLPPLEAMAFGCPVISSNATSLPEVLGEAALYFDPYNLHEMANKIAQVLKDKTLRKSLVEKGKKQVKKYSWEKMAEETLKQYKAISNQRTGDSEQEDEDYEIH